MVVQPVSWGSWPLVLSAEGLSLSRHTPFTRPAVRQAGVLGGGCGLHSVPLPVLQYFRG